MSGDIGDSILIGPGEPPNAPPHEHDRNQRRGNAEHDQRREFSAGRKQQHERAQHHQAIAQKHRKTEADHLADLLGVVGETRADLARARRVEKGRRQGNHVGKHCLAQVGNDALAHAHHEIEANPGRRGKHDRNRDDTRKRRIE